MENNSHEKTAIHIAVQRQGLPTHLFQKPPPWEGIPLEQKQLSICRELRIVSWVIKGWVIGYQLADCSYASALRAYKPFFSFYSVVGIWFISSFFPPLALSSRIVGLSIGGVQGLGWSWAAPDCCPSYRSRRLVDNSYCRGASQRAYVARLERSRVGSETKSNSE